MSQKKTGPATLAIQLLGPFRVSVRGKAVEEDRWARPQAKLLLKLLAVDPKHQLQRQQIMDAIWVDLDERAASASLHKIIHMARRALEPKLKTGAESQFILTRDQQVQLSAPGDLWIDAEAFELKSIQAFRSGTHSECEAALALYGGDLLSDDLYSDWCTRRRSQLRSMHQELLMKVAMLYRDQGQHKLAIMNFEKLVAVEPSNEEAHRELMRLYVLSGRRSEALRQFRRCCDAVRNELDIEPEEATIQLHRRILAKEIRPLPQTGYGQETDTPIDTIAVLPFHNDTGDPGLAYLSTGIAESLIKNLSQLPRLRVLAYSTVARYKGRDLNPRRLGRDLMVRAVAMGRLSRLNGQLSIATELVDTSDGSRLWGDQYRPRQADVLAVQEEISLEISEKLKLQMTFEERKRVGKRYTADPDAYTTYLKGRFHWNKRTAAGLKTALDHFQKAIAKDPLYALAHSGLADCYNLLSMYSVVPPKEAMPKAKAAALKALEIDESLAEAHTSLAYTYLYYDWNWSAAEQEFKLAIHLNPNYATAHHWYHEYLTARGRFEEQMAEVLHAEELDPLSLIINTDVGWGLYYARLYDQAMEQLRRTLELDCNFAVAHLILGLVQAQKGRAAEALASVEKAIELSSAEPFTFALGALGYVLAIGGQTQKARAVIERLNGLSQARYASAYCQAMVLTGLGQAGPAVNCLEKAFEERYDRLIYLNVEPIFEPLKSHADFRDLIRRLAL